MYTAIKTEAQRAATNCDLTANGRFFNRLFGTKWVCLVAIHPFGEAPIQAKCFRGNDRLGIRRWTSERNGRFNIYFGANPVRKPINKKPTKSDVASVDRFFVDLDPKQDETSVQAIKRWRSEVAKFGLQFSELYTSGNGLTGLITNASPYKLNNSSDYQLPESCSAALREMLGGKAMGADHVQNVDRILRVPCTVNIPNEKKLWDGRTVTLAGGVTYTDATLTEFEFEHVYQAQTKSLEFEHYEREDDVSLNELNIPDDLRQLILNGEIDGRSQPSRSEWEWECVLRLMRLGHLPGVIHSILADPDNGISERAFEDPRGVDAHIRTIIARARQHSAAEVHKEFPDDLGPEWVYDLDQSKTESATKRHPFKAITWRELKLAPRPEWLLKRLLAKGWLALIYGQPKAGKTFFVTTLGLSIAAGTPFGPFPLKKGRVLHIVAEGSSSFFKNRVEAFLLSQSKDARQEIERDLEKNWHLVTVPVYMDIEEKVETFLAMNPGQFDLIIIDTLFRNMSKDINQAVDTSKFIAGCERVKSRTNSTVIVVHHDTKSSSTGPLGSQAIIAGPDLIGLITLDKRTNKRALAVEQIRDADRNQPQLEFDLQSFIVGTDEDGEPESSAAVRFLKYEAPKPKPYEVEERLLSLIETGLHDRYASVISSLSLKESTGYDLVKRMKNDGLLRKINKPTLTEMGAERLAKMRDN